MTDPTDRGNEPVTRVTNPTDRGNEPAAAPPTGAAQPVQKSPLASIVSTRKGLAALISTIVGTIAAAGLTATYFQGKLSPGAYYDHLKVIGGIVTAAWIGYGFGTAIEDAGAKSAPTNVVATASGGGDAKVETKVDARPEAITPTPDVPRDVVPRP